MGEWIEIELDEEPTRQRRVTLEPTTPKPPSKPRLAPGLDRGSRRRVGIGVGVALVAAIVWATAQSGGDLSTSEPPSTQEESSESSPEHLTVEKTQPRPSTTRPRTTTTTGPPLVVEQLGGPMLPAMSGLQLVGLTNRGDLVELDLDTGEMTTTDVTGGSGGAQATIIAGEDSTFVQRWDVSSSFVVPRGQLPVDVTATPEMSNGVYRGPEPATLWTLRSDRTTGLIDEMELFSFDGEPLGRSFDLQGWYPMQSDLAGGVLVQTGGGVYTLSEAGARRVAVGEIAGVGVNHFLVRECDDVLACGLFVIDRQSGERRQVPNIRVDGVAQYWWGPTGNDSATVSPDGTGAIVFGLESGMMGAALLETHTGAFRELISANNGPPSFIVWSDDSRFVVYVDNGRLRAYDRSTGETIDFGDEVPMIGSLASRP